MHKKGNLIEKFFGKTIDFFRSWDKTGEENVVYLDRFGKNNYVVWTSISKVPTKKFITQEKAEKYFKKTISDSKKQGFNIIKMKVK